MSKRPSCKTCAKQSWCRGIPLKDKFSWLLLPFCKPRYKIPKDWYSPLLPYAPPEKYKMKFWELHKESNKTGMIQSDKWVKQLLDIYCPLYKRKQWMFYFDFSAIQTLLYPSLQKKSVTLVNKKSFLV